MARQGGTATPTPSPNQNGSHYLHGGATAVSCSAAQGSATSIECRANITFSPEWAAALPCFNIFTVSATENICNYGGNSK